MFLSKTLTDAERNWSTAEREAYAILWALKKTDGFVRGRFVEVITDHKNLQWMMGAKGGKLSRWTILMSEYQLVIKHRSGAQNVVADFLSRNILPDPILDSKTTAFALLVITDPISSSPGDADLPTPVPIGGGAEDPFEMIVNKTDSEKDEPEVKRRRLLAPGPMTDEEKNLRNEGTESVQPRKAKGWTRKPIMEVGDWYLEKPKAVTLGGYPSRAAGEFTRNPATRNGQTCKWGNYLFEWVLDS